ncbi:MAG: PEP-CTERM sorting domain-containing protein [Desulfobacter sp.]|nr:MAG: PEP-CTERM sorting domain-containing protein [Desulfobacter sp.]
MKKIINNVRKERPVMKKIFIFLCFFLFFGTATTVNATPLYCAANGHYYEYVNAQSIDWNTALTAASGLSYLGNQGYLATITSQEENDFLYSLVQPYRNPDSPYYDNAWIGGSDEGDEGNWTWRTGPEAGQTFFYENWGGAEPNGGIRENYTRFIWSNGNWNDIAPNDKWGKGYLVEYNSAPIPEPTTVILLGLGLLSLAGLNRRR